VRCTDWGCCKPATATPSRRRGSLGATAALRNRSAEAAGRPPGREAHQGAGRSWKGQPGSRLPDSHFLAAARTEPPCRPCCSPMHVRLALAHAGSSGAPLMARSGSQERLARETRSRPLAHCVPCNRDVPVSRPRLRDGSSGGGRGYLDLPPPRNRETAPVAGQWPVTVRRARRFEGGPRQVISRLPSLLRSGGSQLAPPTLAASDNDDP
jgi:hypothetical protein